MRSRPLSIAPLQVLAFILSLALLGADAAAQDADPVIGADGATGITEPESPPEGPIGDTGCLVDGAAVEQMADELGISINTVGSRLAKCLEKMRKMLSSDAFFGEDFRLPDDGSP